MVENFDVVVVGLGGMGSAGLYEFAKHGVKVCGIEQFRLGHDQGSSHGQTRMIRKAYFEHPGYMPMLARAYELWHNLEEISGETLLTDCVLAIAAEPYSRTIDGLQRCYSEYELPHEKIDAAEFTHRFQQFRLPPDFVVYLDPVAGFLHVEKCVMTQVALAKRSGAKIYENERLCSFDATADSVTLQTDKRTISAAKAVFTCGPWAGLCLQDAGIPLEVWSKTVCWFATQDISAYWVGRFPMFYLEFEAGTLYGFPAIDSLGIKVGEHVIPTPVSDANAIRRELISADQDLIRKLMQNALPHFSPQRTRWSVCMYTKTPDDHFVIDVHPQHDNVAFAAGFSGHGFKFAPVVGEILADLTLNGYTEHPIAFLKRGRF